jgi:hypothetical protein
VCPARDSAFHCAFPGSPDLHRRSGSPCAAALRRRHSGSPPMSPQSARRRPDEFSIGIGAPQLDFAVAPPFTAAAPPYSRRRRPRLAAAHARTAPAPLDLHLTVQIASSRGVNRQHTGQPPAATRFAKEALAFFNSAGRSPHHRGAFTNGSRSLRF